MYDHLPAIVRKFGILTIADAINVTPSAVSQWRKVPLSRVVLLAETLRITPNEIRPDLFPKGTTVAEAAQYQLQHDPRSRTALTRLFRQKIKREKVTIRRGEWQAAKTLAQACAAMNPCRCSCGTKNSGAIKRRTNSTDSTNE
ncbi:hypothetical protein ACJU26_05325 [Acidithiobacillus sp. M4-SHS-6]|uniref:hypothetical protein n=1 Tax=Acidithiobacillus sp. M4-SHS-6 TaxID=3383024 RepID=UPI0039BEB7FA